MKNQINIRLMIINYTEELKDHILENIQNSLKKLDPNISCKWLGSEQYWKIPENMETIFSTTGENLTVKKIVTVFECPWIYSESIGHYVDNPKKAIDFEYAIWNKQEETDFCINKHVVWAHIYTW